MVALHAVAAGEAAVVHRVAGEDADVLAGDVLDDGLGVGDRRRRRGGQLSGPRDPALLALPHHHRHRLAALLLAHEDEAAVGVEVVEDRVHHPLKKLRLLVERAHQRDQLVQHVELELRGLSRLGRAHDDRVVAALDLVLQVDVHLPALHRTQPRARLPLAGGEGEGAVAEAQKRGARADLVAVLQRPRAGDADAVHEGPVAGFQVAQHPGVVLGVGRELHVPPRDRAVRERERLAGAPDLLRLVVGELEAAAAVGPCDDGENKHAVPLQRPIGASARRVRLDAPWLAQPASVAPGSVICSRGSSMAMASAGEGPSGPTLGPESPEPADGCAIMVRPDAPYGCAIGVNPRAAPSNPPAAP